VLNDSSLGAGYCDSWASCEAVSSEMVTVEMSEGQLLGGRLWKGGKLRDARQLGSMEIGEPEGSV